MEYISKQSLLADLNEATPRSYFAFETMVREYPTEDVAPVVHAHWIINPKYSIVCNCSNCGVAVRGGFGENYCFNCGAKMDEEVDNGG